MNQLKNIIPALFLLFAISCDLEQEIDIQLPDYDNGLVLECYLEPGQPFALLLSKSAAYFDPFPTLDAAFLDHILEDSAQVSISYRGNVFPLSNRTIFNPLTRKIYNYINFELVPADFEHDFELKIVTKDGKTIEAVTRILPKIPIDSVVVQFDEKNDSLARVLTYLTDDPNQKNYFRRMLHKGDLDTLPEQDFISDDRIVEDLLVFGTGYDYKLGDTIINTIYHIDDHYFNFLESYLRASVANGNPFTQPSPIISNLNGTANAIGIFTGLSFDRKVTILKR